MAKNGTVLLVMAKPLQLEEIETPVSLFIPLIVELMLDRSLLLYNENSENLTQFSPKHLLGVKNGI